MSSLLQTSSSLHPSSGAQRAKITSADDLIRVIIDKIASSWTDLRSSKTLLENFLALRSKFPTDNIALQMEESEISLITLSKTRVQVLWGEMPKTYGVPVPGGNRSTLLFLYREVAGHLARLQRN